MPRTQYDTIVVGMGAAGVTAATTLVKAGKVVLGLEAQGRIGGRINTVPLGDGIVELGAEWIHGESPSIVYDAVLKNNIPVMFQDLTFSILQSDGVLPHQSFQDLVNDLILQAFALMQTPPEKPEPLGHYLTNRLLTFLKQNKPELLKDTCFIDQILDFLNLLTNNYCATNDWNDLNACDKYTPVDGHQHISWHKHGFKTLFDILLNTYQKNPGLPTLDIKLNTEVTQIYWPQDPNENTSVLTKDGSLYTASNVIVTVSVGVLKESHRTLFVPKLPHQKILAIENQAIGVMDKIILSFNEICWPCDKTFFGFLWKADDLKKIGREDYWVTRIFGASIPMGSHNSLTLWTSGEVAKLVETLPEDLVKRKCIEILQMFMGPTIKVTEPIAVLRSTWYTNPFTRGSYTYDSIHSASYSTIRADLAAPLTDFSGKLRVLFAGEATHETNFSTVHGACETGFREALKLLPGPKL